jgi:hypothetical protein
MKRIAGESVDTPGERSFEVAESISGDGENFPPGMAGLGHLDGVDGEGRPMFRPEGGSVSVPVVIGVGMADEEIVRAAWTGRRALVVRTGGNAPKLVLVGFPREHVAAKARDAWPAEVEVRMDGETVFLKARRKIELVCGKSRIVLDADGRVEVNGSYLLSRSRGPVKIKGATVEIN